MLAVPCEVTTLLHRCIEGVTAMMVRFMALLGALLFALEPAHADQVLVCTPRSGSRSPTTLLIKGAPYTPTEIVWPGWGQDGVRKFTIKSYSDAHYTALERDVKGEDTAGRIYINRLDGQLTLENHIIPEARAILVKLCDGEITRDACLKQQGSLQGGHPSTCFAAEARPQTECERWKHGSNLLSTFVYSCVPGLRKF